MAAVVVGLGNPGPEYRDTRHNVGQRVLDHLARALRGHWQPDGRAFVARATWCGEAVVLARPVCFMNESGPVVAETLQRLGAQTGDLILVHDDIDLPVGTVRVRMRGRHGGHNGVRSVIESLGTTEIRRVKVGVGRPEPGAVVDHVLTPFQPDEEPVVAAAVARAADRVLALVQTPSPS